MFKSRKQKVVRVFMVVLVLVVGMLSYQFINQYKEEQRQWELFLNYFYFAHEHSINRIDYLIEMQPKDDDLDAFLRETDRELRKANSVITYGRTLMNNDLYISKFFLNAAEFLYGVNFYPGPEVPPMNENGMLDDDDLALLETIRDYLSEAQEELHSNLSEQENPDLSLDEVNDIINTYLNYSKHDIYEDTFEN
ncbi:hypothetical protein [Alkalibacillus aidingensis]|uniref:hypothetical protein n=1 Tax=Alkalibacillus aidingensis TaxID=2747607 RepID=UPI0016617870|nr:hypothetical protein [Alkalibacillus aidingensis]